MESNFEIQVRSDSVWLLFRSGNNEAVINAAVLIQNGRGIGASTIRQWIEDRQQEAANLQQEVNKALNWVDSATKVPGAEGLYTTIDSKGDCHPGINYWSKHSGWYVTDKVTHYIFLEPLPCKKPAAKPTEG